MRMYPIMGAPDIPWEMIAPHEERAETNHDQTLDRLAERGGLGAIEAVWILTDNKWCGTLIPEDGGEAKLAKLVEAWTDGRS